MGLRVGVMRTQPVWVSVWSAKGVVTAIGLALACWSNADHPFARASRGYRQRSL